MYRINQHTFNLCNITDHKTNIVCLLLKCRYIIIIIIIIILFNIKALNDYHNHYDNDYA